MEFLNWLFADNGILKTFIWGAIMMACLAIGVFFFRFWRQTGDRLFAIFGFAFFLLGIERLLLAYLRSPTEAGSFIYITRLVAFILIILAIIDKNRSGGTHG